MPSLASRERFEELGEASSLRVAAPEGDVLPQHRLMGNVAVRGLSDDEFVMPAEADFAFTDVNGRRATFHLNKGLVNGYRYVDYTHFVLERIQEVLSSGLRALDSGSHSMPGYVSSALHPSDLKGVRPGKLEGDIGFAVHALAYLGQGSLEKGSEWRHGGHGLRFLEVTATDQQLAFEVMMWRPALMGSGLKDEQYQRFGGALSARWFIGVVDSATGVVRLTQLQGDAVVSSFPVTLRTFSRMVVSGIPVDIDGAPPQIHVFRVIPRGPYSSHFSWDNHQVVLDWSAESDPLAAAAHGGGSEGGATILTSLEEVQSVRELTWITPEVLAKSSQALRARAAALFADDWKTSLELAPWPYHWHWEFVNALRAGQRQL